MSVTATKTAREEVLGTCNKCGRYQLLFPLYSEKGGPLFCLGCGIDWHAKYSRKRKLGRIVVKALKAFSNAGGTDWDIQRLKIRSYGFDMFGDGAEDTLGADVGDITAELLDDTIRLTHPDIHPPERHALATRVTQELLALKPFVFPAPKPEPRNDSAKVSMEDYRASVTSAERIGRLKASYPCATCAGEAPYYYCNACRTEWEKRQQKEREAAAAKQRQYRKRRRMMKLGKCSMCQKKFLGKRKDARYCSLACRQSAHRQRRAA